MVLSLALAACGDAPSETAEATAVPAGLAEFPMRLPVNGRMAPVTLHETFAGFAVPGVVPHLLEVAEQPALLLLEIDLELFDPLLVGTDGERHIGVSAGQALRDANLDLLIGSSFVSELNSLTPVGLLQIDGNTISPLQRHGYTRVLGVRDGGLGVVGIRSYNRGMFDSAMQVGPGVVEQGALDISVRDLQRPKYFRTFVATCGNTAVIGVSQVPMHLYTLGKRFLEFADSLASGCDEVVNLAGDREVVLAMVSRDRSQMAYFGHPGTAKAALLGFRRKL